MGFSPRGNIQLRRLHSTYSIRATTTTIMRQLSLLLLLSVAMLCSASTLRVKRDATTTTTPKTTTAKHCHFHSDCGTTQACSQSKCRDLCFSDDCNKGVNNARAGWYGETPLHRAAKTNSVDLAKRLVENSANVNSADVWGKAALHYAAYWNSVDVANLLLENSADVDSTDNGGYKGLTPLQVAIRRRNQEMVDLLRNA